MANKITTLGYTLKRLRDSGYYAHKIFSDYGKHDPRCWTLVIDPKGMSVFCTCYVNDPFIGDSYFEVYDGSQYLPSRLKIKTNSFEVLVEQLLKHNITPTKKV